MNAQAEITIPDTLQPVNKTHVYMDEIIQRLATQEPMRDIAKDFDVSASRISQIKKKKQDEIDVVKAVLHDKFAPTYIKRTIIENEAAYDLVKDGYSPTEITESFLTRQDKKGNKILEGIGILESRNGFANYGNIQVNNKVTNQRVSAIVSSKIGESVLDELSRLGDEDIT